MLVSDIEGDICFLAQRLNRKISRQVEHELKGLGLSSEQATLMSAVGASPSLRVKDLAEILHLDSSTISANLKPLLRRGIISVTADPTDRRARNLALTREGTYLLGAANRILDQLQAKCIARLPRDLDLSDILEKMRAVANCDAISST